MHCSTQRGAHARRPAGSSRHEAATLRGVDREGVEAAIVEAACGHMPALEGHVRRSRRLMHKRWGPRPASRRGWPYIGRVRGCNGLVIASGHEGSGLTMALSTADLVCSLLTDGPLPDYAEALAV